MMLSPPGPPEPPQATPVSVRLWCYLTIAGAVLPKVPSYEIMVCGFLGICAHKIGAPIFIHQKQIEKRTANQNNNRLSRANLSMRLLSQAGESFLHSFPSYPTP